MEQAYKDLLQKYNSIIFMSVVMEGFCSEAKKIIVLYNVVLRTSYDRALHIVCNILHSDEKQGTVFVLKNAQKPFPVFCPSGNINHFESDN